MRSCYSRTKTLNEAISYSMLCKRARMLALGVGKGSRRLDLCTFCVTFDQKVQPAVDRTLRYCDRLRTLTATYFDAMPVEESWGEVDINKAASPACLTRVLEWIHTQSAPTSS
jgi:hypothetical protein